MCFEQLFDEYLTDFEVTKVLLFEHCVRIMNFESVRAFRGWTFSGQGLYAGLCIRAHIQVYFD